MSNVRARTGSTGHTLIRGLDVTGTGIQVDTTEYYEPVIKTHEAKPDKWKKVLLVNLINSSIDSLHLLGQDLRMSGYDLFLECKYARKNFVYFLIIQGREFRIHGHTILEKGKVSQEYYDSLGE